MRPISLYHETMIMLETAAGLPGRLYKSATTIITAKNDVVSGRPQADIQGSIDCSKTIPLQRFPYWRAQARV